MFSRFLLFALLSIALMALRLHAAESNDAVTLPPFIVEEASKGPPWRYTEMPGFEILSRCRDRTTRELALAHYRLHRLLELLLPERLQLAFAAPKAIIFYDEALQPAASQEVIASMMRRATKEQAPVDLGALDLGRFGLRGAPSASSRRISFLPNLRLWDRDEMAVFAIVRDGGYDADRLVLTGDYVSYLLLNRTPALPWWFVSGVLRLYELTDYESKALTIHPITWISEEETDAVKHEPKTATAPLPLAEFFSSGPPAATPENEARRKLWIAQGTLFLRWALDGRTPAQREAFFEFVVHATTGVTPAAFQRCFGVDFAAADVQLAAYLPTAVRKTVTLRPAHPLVPPPIELRDASEVDIARIKGDWERLEVGFVRAHTPELTDKYLEQARRTLHRAYDRDGRDPRLLAALGLCECDAGDDAAAREFLEAAARLGPLRPRAGYELARLRLAAAAAKPEGAGDRLSVDQVKSVFTPLFAVREAAPPLPEVYELIAKVWACSAVPPTRGHLAVLDEGVRLFPRHSSLVYQTAALFADNGFPAEGAEYVRLGVLFTADAAERERFTSLKARLDAATVPAK